MATYEWLTGIEAVLHRPDAYVGAVDAVDAETHVLDADDVPQLLQYCISPVFCKIFDEILVNAVDSTTRDSLVANVAVNFDKQSGQITVENDGSGIPITPFKDTERWLPSVLFSELHSGSNFQDSESRTAGGRNGVGAACTNVWSTRFRVEISDCTKHFSQQFADNLKVVEEPKVAATRSKRGFVKVCFVPDYARLALDLGKNAQLIDTLLRHRTREAAVCVHAGVAVLYNGTKLDPKPQLLLQKLASASAAGLEKFGEEGQPGAVLAFAQRSATSEDFTGFVNGVRCDSGTLATHLRDRFCKLIAEAARKKHNVTIKPATVREVLAILCVARIVNPRFTTQAKTHLATPSRQFGFSFDLPARVMTKLVKLGVLDEVVRREQDRDLNSSLKRTLVPKNREVYIEKYDPALDSRSAPESCTLVLTEGDSAKAFVVAGLSVLGRSKYGIFPLRGVPLNVTHASTTDMLKNHEISSIFKILNCAPNSSGDGLRYGRIAICSDQDADGSHICGLLLNLFSVTLPKVLEKRPDFLQRIVTPLIRASAKRGSAEPLAFYSMQQFKERFADVAAARDFNLKYYKGLGTSSSKEARAVFSDIDKHRVTLEFDAAAAQSLSTFYDQRRVDERKRLLTSAYDGSTSVDYAQPTVAITDFMMREHVHFSHYGRASRGAVLDLPCAAFSARWFDAKPPQGALPLSDQQGCSGEGGTGSSWRGAAHALPARRGLLDRDDRQPGPGLRGHQQHRTPPAHRPVRLAEQQALRARRGSLHLHATGPHGGCALPS